MRLKEIKPGMVIHCRTDKEIKAISDAGFTGFLGRDITGYMTPECYVIIRERNTADWTNDFQTAADFGKIIEFSDLILQELTEIEVWLGIASVEDDEIFEYFQCCGYETREALIKNAGWKDLVAIVEKHIAANEKKEPEIETVNICRIIEIQPDGRKRCVHEEDIVSDLPFGGNERQIVEEILKRYCMEHEGEFIAVHEVVSRVKR